MASGIFIKTWAGDIPWLKYALDSIEMYSSGFNDLVIVTDVSCYRETKLQSKNFTVRSVADWENGYIQQQLVKLYADKYIDSDQILYVDSDCVFHTPFTPESFMRDNKPILMKTKYGNLGGAEVWKNITEEFVGFPVEYEYMRRLPWMYLKESLQNFRKMYPNTIHHLKHLKTRDFSEFNALGAYIDKFESCNYFITDTNLWFPEAVAEQFWSWGGITAEVKAKIDSYLKG